VELVSQRLEADVPRYAIAKETVDLGNGAGRFIPIIVVLYLIRYMMAHQSLIPLPVVAQASLMLVVCVRIHA